MESKEYNNEYGQAGAKLQYMYIHLMSNVKLEKGQGIDRAPQDVG